MRASRVPAGLLEAAMDGSGDGFWAWDANAQPSMWYSAGALEFLGRRPEELSGRLREARSWVQADDLELWRESFEAHFAGATPIAEVEVRLHLGDGRVRRARLRATAERDAQGRPIRVAGSLRDTTAQRDAEEALEGSRRMLQAVLDAIPVRVFWKDLANDYVGCNQSFAEDAGVAQPSAIEGKTDFELAWTDQAELYRADDQQVMRSGRSKLNYEEPQLRPDGRTAWLRTSKVPLFDGAGNVNGVLGCYEDITAQKRLEEELRQAQKLEAVGRLAGGIAHDFNNVLTVILAGANVLRDSLGRRNVLEPAEAGDLDSIHDAAERAAGITRKLLAFSRREHVNPEVVTLEQVLAGIEPMLRSLVGDSIELDLRPSDESIHVQMDPRQLEPVILNLVINARDAMPSGGRIEVSTGCNTEDARGDGEVGGTDPTLHATLEVKDHGVGIEADDLERVFEPFFTTKRLGEGTGLGLSTVHGIITASGGQVRALSSPGLGSCFTVWLPAANIVPEAPHPAKAPPKATHGSETILLVEDDVSIRRLAQHVLRARGYEVLEAPSAREAVQLAATFAGRIHLVLTDVIMPELNGREVAERVTAKRPDCRVLFMSGYTADIIADRGVPFDSASLLEKPFTATQLLERVREALDAETT